MPYKIIISFVVCVMALGLSTARADDMPYSKSQLAGYISGKISVTLDEDAVTNNKICRDDEGCVIVVH